MSLMSLPISVFWGDERKPPRLRDWWSLSEGRETTLNPNNMKNSLLLSDSYPRHRRMRSLGSQWLLLTEPPCGRRLGRNESLTLETEHPRPPSLDWRPCLEPRREWWSVSVGSNHACSLVYLNNPMWCDNPGKPICHCLSHTHQGDLWPL